MVHYSFTWGVNKNIHFNIYTDMNYLYLQKYMNFVSTFFESLEKILPLNKDFCITIDCKFFEYTKQIVFNSFLENEGVKNFYPETYYNEKDTEHLIFFSTYRLYENAFKKFHLLNILYFYYNNEEFFFDAFYDCLDGIFTTNIEEKLKKRYFKNECENFYINGLEYDIKKEGFNFSRILWSDNSLYSFIVQDTEQ